MNLVLPMVCKPLQTRSLECCPLIPLIPPESTTIRSIRQRRGHTLSLQFFSWAWTPHWVILIDSEPPWDYTAFNAYFHISDLLSLKDYTSAPFIPNHLRVTDSAVPNKSGRTKPDSSMAKPGKKHKNMLIPDDSRGRDSIVKWADSAELRSLSTIPDAGFPMAGSSKSKGHAGRGLASSQHSPNCKKHWTGRGCEESILQLPWFRASPGFN